MPKGFFTQTVCILLKRPVSIERAANALTAFNICASRPPAESWVFGGPSLTLAFRPEVNGYVAVDIIDRPWPDSMGDPNTDSEVFGAWTLGQFGPFTYPRGLERASQHSWAWEGGRSIAHQHSGFIRVRTSYLFGADGDLRVMPPDYDAASELRFVTDVAISLLDIPESLCYFNPNGEILRDRQGVLASLAQADSQNLPPLNLWSNVRLFNLESGWLMMDTVGSRQLDLPDVEACFTRGYDCSEVDGFLRNVIWYLMQKGEVIRDGDTMDGPGEIRWWAHNFSEAVALPPRSTLSWIPRDGKRPPEQFLKRGGQ